MRFDNRGGVIYIGIYFYTVRFKKIHAQQEYFPIFASLPRHDRHLAVSRL